MLIMSGMSNFLYWIGLYLADLVLLIFPWLLFSLFVLLTRIDGFFQELGELMLIVFSFGSALIPLIYLISTAFHDSVTAGKCIAPILIVCGNIVPLVILPWIFGTAAQAVGLFCVGLLYFSNPFMTLFAGSYTLLVGHFTV